jgi:hypothetical protein
MTPPPLHSARLKLGRAAELLDEVQRLYDEDNKASAVTGPHEAPSEQIFEPITGRTWYVVRLQIDPPPLDERLALLVGDAMHNTRSALDHLACRLVEHNNGQVTNRTAFPIFPKEPQRKTREDERYSAAIEGMNPEHKKAIRALQPFSNRGTDEARRLIALSALDNTDKHRLLLPALSTVGDKEARPPLIQTDIPAPFDYIWNGGKALEKEVELFRFSPRGPIGEIRRFDFEVIQRIVYGDVAISLSELREIRAYAVGILESFVELR